MELSLSTMGFLLSHFQTHPIISSTLEWVKTKKRFHLYIYIYIITHIYILCKTKNIHNSITTSFTTFYHHNVNRTPPFFFCQLISPGANCEAWRWSEGSGFHGKIIEDHRSKWANFGAMMSFMPFWDRQFAGVSLASGMSGVQFLIIGNASKASVWISLSLKIRSFVICWLHLLDSFGDLYIIIYNLSATLCDW